MLIIASAKSCYSNKLVKDIVLNKKESDKFLLSLYNAGHHTVFQHINITLKIEKISRYFIWKFLHSHPNYNSEQVSQRYVKVGMNNFYGDEHKDFFLSRVKDYYQLIDILGSKELARYVLPMATTAHMYHTINLLTAFRYLSICYSIKTKEAIEFAKLVENEIDDDLTEVLKIVTSTKTILPDYKLEFNGVKVKAIAPINYDITNSLDVLKTSNVLTSSLATGSLRSRLKVSLSCDSQLQRHRRAITIRSKLDLNDGYYIPKAILENKQALDIYKKANDEAIELILKTGNEYLFLNSQYVILEQQEDLESFFHKAQLRLCLNSQDEIRDVIKSQIEGLKTEGIDTSIFKEPCVTRYKNNIKPICPEGERFCGVKMWLKETER